MDTSTQFDRPRKVDKVNLADAPAGPLGQRRLAAGEAVGMRVWIEERPVDGEETQRDYETVGFALKGRAELWLEGRRIVLVPGDSWVVPAGARHAYRIDRSFAAVEATSPPERIAAATDSTSTATPHPPPRVTESDGPFADAARRSGPDAPPGTGAHPGTVARPGH